MSGWASPAVHDEVDAVLERLALGRRRHGAVRDRPERVERRVARGVRLSRLDDAEEVVDAIDLVGAIERIALQVQEQVAGRRLRQQPETAIRNNHVLAVAFGRDALRDHPALAAHLDRRLGLHPGQRIRADAVQQFGQRRRRVRQSTPRGHVNGVQGASLAGRQVGHQRQIVFATPLGAAIPAPAAEVAVLHGFRLGRDWKRRFGVVQQRLELPRDQAVVGPVVGDPKALGPTRDAAQHQMHPFRRPPLHSPKQV